MAGTLTYQINLTGLNEAKKGLQEILSLLKQIFSLSGKIGVPTGPGGVSPVGVPLSPGEIAGAAVLGAGAGLAGRRLFQQSKGVNIFSGSPRTNPQVPPDQLGRTAFIGQMFKPYAQEIKDFLAGKGGQPFKRGVGTIGERPPLSLKQALGFEGMSLMAIFTKLSVIAFGLYEAFKHLIDAFKQGAEVFQNAARQASTVKESFQLMESMKAIGISGQATERMLAQAEFNRNAKLGAVPGSSAILGAAKVSGFADIQQLMNMSKQFEAAMRGAEANSRQMEQSVGASVLNTMIWNGVVREFKTLMVQLTTALWPLIGAVLALTKLILKTANFILEWIIKLEQLIPGMKVDAMLGKEHFAASTGGGGGHGNAWSGLGFWIQGGPDKILREIAVNTKETADNIRKLVPQSTVRPPMSAIYRGYDLGMP